VEILPLQLRYKFGWGRSRRQHQQDCIMQHSSVSAHCFCVCLCCCQVNVKELRCRFCERLNLPVRQKRSVFVIQLKTWRDAKTHSAFSKASKWNLCSRLSFSSITGD
jgi:hypothetical protein